MNYNHLKITALSLLFLSLVKFSSAQSNYFKLSGGFGLGANYSYTDVLKGTIGHTVYGTFDYHITPFVTVGVEGQYGLVQGGDIETDPNNRQFVNKYTAATANLKLMLGEIVDYKRNNFLYNIRGLYAGVGVGVINNNIVDIVRYRPNDPNSAPFPGKNKSHNLLLPANLGFNYYIKDGYGYMRYVINFNAQTNFVVGDGLDGYTEPKNSTVNNNASDVYTAYTIGFRYFFGNIKVYRKML